MSIDGRDQTKCIVNSLCVTRRKELILDAGHGATPNIYDDMVWLVTLSKSVYIYIYIYNYYNGPTHLHLN